MEGFTPSIRSSLQRKVRFFIKFLSFNFTLKHSFHSVEVFKAYEMVQSGSPVVSTKIIGKTKSR